MPSTSDLYRRGVADAKAGRPLAEVDKALQSAYTAGYYSVAVKAPRSRPSRITVRKAEGADPFNLGLGGSK